MKFAKSLLLHCTVILLASAAMNAQQAANSSTRTIVPPLVNYSGTAMDAEGKSIAGIASITFSIYENQYQGAPLWLETQNVTAGSNGNYTVQLGTSSAEGLPLDVFASGEARWLGVRVNGEEEQPRVLLLSVPYALKAADAETIGGLPPSAFVLATPQTANAATATSGSNAALVKSAATSDVTTTGGTAKTIPLFTTATNIQNSILTQTGTTAVSVGGNLSATGVVTGSSFQIGSNLFAFGSYANENAFLGFAGNTTTTGNANIASGYQALYSNTTGVLNTASGYQALYSNTSGYQNTASGDWALYSNSTGNYNTASGAIALYSNTTGSNNTATGIAALSANTTGSNNTATGYGALESISIGGPNEAFGFQALASNTASNGQAFGYQALFNNTTGAGNQAFGYRTMYTNTTGYYNAAFGGEALYSNTTGQENTAVGGSALYGNTAGSYNTAVGQLALESNGTGSSLTCVGYSCTASDAITNATAIGAHARVEQSNSLVLGGTGDHAVRVGIGTTKPSNVLTVARGAGHPVSDSWETYSSRRWKTNIQTLPDALSKVEQLRGVSYDLKDSGKHEIGVIAEEVGAVVPEVVSYEKNGKDASGVDYSRLTALLIEAVKEQQGLIRKQQAQIRTQQSLMKAQQVQIVHLGSQVKSIQASLKTNGLTGSELRTVKEEMPTVHQ